MLSQAFTGLLNTKATITIAAAVNGTDATSWITKIFQKSKISAGVAVNTTIVFARLSRRSNKIAAMSHPMTMAIKNEPIV